MADNDDRSTAHIPELVAKKLVSEARSKAIFHITNPTTPEDVRAAAREFLARDPVFLKQCKGNGYNATFCLDRRPR